jgi:hypothetical protein
MFIVRLLSVLIVVCMFLNTQIQDQVHSRFGQIGGSLLSGWHRDEQCKYQLINVLQTFIKTNAMNQNKEGNWSVYLPCGYNRAEQELKKIKSTDKDQKIFIIKGCDNLSRKDTLWNNLKVKYGDKAGLIMPESYLLHNIDDVHRLSKEYDSDKVYILKKNIQRQQGLKMTKNIKALLQGSQQGYVVAQEMLQDPYLIDSRKTNCRVYLLVVCKNGKKHGYVYSDGFMYYTPQDFRKGSMDIERVITAGLSTGRKDESFYKNHPLTIKEFQQLIGPKVNLLKRTGVLMANVLAASAPNFCNTGHLRDRTTFQLFGCDVAFNDKLQPQLIEINKGPDLTSKSHEETVLKDDLIANIFKVIKVPVTVKTTGKLNLVWSE